MLYVKIVKKAIATPFLLLCSLGAFCSENSEATNSQASKSANSPFSEITKYKKWQEAIERPQDFKNVFLFFFNNSHWPLFEETVKIAEKNIKLGQADDIVFRWFQKYPPKTASGTKIFSKLLLEKLPEFGKNYIKQTWIFQNLTPDFAKEYREEFKDILTTTDDAKRAKVLINTKKLFELQSMQKYIDPSVSKYIKDYLKSIKNKLEKDNILNLAKRFDKVQKLIDQKKISAAAKILSETNLGEEARALEFFTKRRHVACELIRSGKFDVAYKVLEMNKLDKASQPENFSKAQWLLGFISYRFKKDFVKAEKHFENAYRLCTNPIRISKNAFWLAEVLSSMDEVLSAIEWYKKAERHFNTFYGCLAHLRLLELSKDRFSLINDYYNGEKENVPTELEFIFNNRELVRTLKALTKSGANIDEATLLRFYEQLVVEIENPIEETLILSLPISDKEFGYIMNFAANKQLYFNNKKSFKILNQKEQNLIKQVNSDPCFLALVHAIIRRESNFRTDAQSHSGAVGLMQIMPKTATYEAKRIKFYVGNESLFNRKKNITIGASIVNRLLKKYKNNLALSIPAYNCGEGNISKFQKSIKNLKNLTVLDLIELMPIKESRIYTKHVFHNFFVYQKLFGAQNCFNFNQIFAIAIP